MAPIIIITMTATNHEDKFFVFMQSVSKILKMRNLHSCRRMLCRRPPPESSNHEPPAPHYLSSRSSSSITMVKKIRNCEGLPVLVPQMSHHHPLLYQLPGMEAHFCIMMITYSEETFQLFYFYNTINTVYINI